MFRMTGNGLHQWKGKGNALECCSRYIRYHIQAIRAVKRRRRVHLRRAGIHSMVERPRCSLSALFIRRTQLVSSTSTHEQSSEWENLIVGLIVEKKQQPKTVWLSGLGWHFRWHLKCTLIFAGELWLSQLSKLAKQLNVSVFRGDLPHKSQTRVYHGLIE